jgi:hypothetical protein
MKAYSSIPGDSSKLALNAKKDREGLELLHLGQTAIVFHPDKDWDKREDGSTKKQLVFETFRLQYGLRACLQCVSQRSVFDESLVTTPRWNIRRYGESRSRILEHALGDRGL